MQNLYTNINMVMFWQRDNLQTVKLTMFVLRLQLDQAILVSLYQKAQHVFAQTKISHRHMDPTHSITQIHRWRTLATCRLPVSFCESDCQTLCSVRSSLMSVLTLGALLRRNSIQDLTRSTHNHIFLSLIDSGDGVSYSCISIFDSSYRPSPLRHHYLIPV